MDTKKRQGFTTEIKYIFNIYRRLHWMLITLILTTYYSELSGEKGSPFVSLLHFKDVQGINNNRLEKQGLAIQSLHNQKC